MDDLLSSLVSLLNVLEERLNLGFLLRKYIRGFRKSQKTVLREFIVLCSKDKKEISTVFFCRIESR